MEDPRISEQVELSMGATAGFLQRMSERPEHAAPASSAMPVLYRLPWPPGLPSPMGFVQPEQSRRGERRQPAVAPKVSSPFAL